MKTILSTAEVPSFTVISDGSEICKEEENGSYLIWQVFLNIGISSHFEILKLA